MCVFNDGLIIEQRSCIGNICCRVLTGTDSDGCCRCSVSFSALCVLTFVVTAPVTTTSA